MGTCEEQREREEKHRRHWLTSLALALPEPLAVDDGERQEHQYNDDQGTAGQREKSCVLGGYGGDGDLHQVCSGPTCKHTSHTRWSPAWLGPAPPCPPLSDLASPSRSAGQRLALRPASTTGEGTARPSARLPRGHSGSARSTSLLRRVPTTPPPQSASPEGTYTEARRRVSAWCRGCSPSPAAR